MRVWPDYNIVPFDSTAYEIERKNKKLEELDSKLSLRGITGLSENQRIALSEIYDEERLNIILGSKDLVDLTIGKISTLSEIYNTTKLSTILGSEKLVFLSEDKIKSLSKIYNKTNLKAILDSKDLVSLSEEQVESLSNISNETGLMAILNSENLVSLSKDQIKSLSNIYEITKLKAILDSENVSILTIDQIEVLSDYHYTGNIGAINSILGSDSLISLSKNKIKALFEVRGSENLDSIITSKHFGDLDTSEVYVLSDIVDSTIVTSLVASENISNLRIILSLEKVLLKLGKRQIEELCAITDTAELKAAVALVKSPFLKLGDTLEVISLSPEKKKEECCICYVEFGDEEVAKTTCNHLFHTGCIKRWLGQVDDNGRKMEKSCPMCRRE